MKPKVLIVEDNESSVVLLRSKMEADGYEVAAARDGVEALEKVGAFHPDLIMLDIMMPRMDGFEVCRRLKGREETRYIPVVMLTARGELEDKLMGLELGAEDYISKPYKLVEVSARVKSLLRMRFLQTRLRESEKMAALGEIVDGIAHEVRNPLTTIGGMARHLYERETDERLKHYAVTIMKSITRLERMLRRIDDYKRVLVSHLRPGNINEVIEKAVEEAGRLRGDKKIDIKTSLLADPSPVNLDTENLKTAILNILQNSIEAIDDEGEIRLGSHASGDNTIVLSVTDTGSGMDEETMRDIFNPFHTSRMTGAGLGLTITYKVMQDHGATIEVESEKGRGTTITLKFHIIAGIRAV